MTRTETRKFSLCAGTGVNDLKFRHLSIQRTTSITIVSFLLQDLNGFDDSVDSEPVVNGFADEEVIKDT